jgi:hypothetical protein
VLDAIDVVRISDMAISDAPPTRYRKRFVKTALRISGRRNLESK